MILLNKKFLDHRKAGLIQAGFPVSKWIIFAEEMLRKGYEVKLYSSKSTVSKYLYVMKGSRQFKVRFSNHKPSYEREIILNDCDFFVGVCRKRTTTTEDAIHAVDEFFNKR